MQQQKETLDLVSRSLKAHGDDYDSIQALRASACGALFQALVDRTIPQEQCKRLMARATLLILAQRGIPYVQGQIHSLLGAFDQTEREIVSSYLDGFTERTKTLLSYSPLFARALVIEGGDPQLRSQGGDKFFEEVQPALVSLAPFSKDEASRAHPVSLSRLKAGDTLRTLFACFESMMDEHYAPHGEIERDEISLQIRSAARGVGALPKEERQEVYDLLIGILTSPGWAAQFSQDLFREFGEPFEKRVIDTLETRLNHPTHLPLSRKANYSSELRMAIMRGLARRSPEEAPKLRAFLLEEFAGQLEKREGDFGSRGWEPLFCCVGLLLKTSPIPPELLRVASDTIEEARSWGRYLYSGRSGYRLINATELSFQILRIADHFYDRPLCLLAKEYSGGWRADFEQVQHSSGALYRSLRQINRAKFSPGDNEIIDTFERSSQHCISVDEADRAHARAVCGPLAYRLGIGLEKPLGMMDLADFLPDPKSRDEANQKAAADYFRMEGVLPDTAQRYPISRLTLPPYTRYLVRLMSAHRSEEVEQRRAGR